MDRAASPEDSTATEESEHLSHNQSEVLNDGRVDAGFNGDASFERAIDEAALILQKTFESEVLNQIDLPQNMANQTRFEYDQFALLPFPVRQSVWNAVAALVHAPPFPPAPHV